MKNLSYKISKYPPKLKHKDVDVEVQRAFNVWTDYTDLTFTPKTGQVHIEIRFETGEHGDGDPFDGPGGTLAHAYFPVSKIITNNVIIGDGALSICARFMFTHLLITIPYAGNTLANGTAPILNSLTITKLHSPFTKKVQAEGKLFWCWCLWGESSIQSMVFVWALANTIIYTHILSATPWQSKCMLLV